MDDVKAGTNGTFAELVEAVNNKCDQDYNPGQVPEDIIIKWEWPFEIDAAGNTSDTNLGNGTASLEVIVTYTATQLD